MFVQCVIEQVDMAWRQHVAGAELHVVGGVHGRSRRPTCEWWSVEDGVAAADRGDGGGDVVIRVADPDDGGGDRRGEWDGGEIRAKEPL
eukprot:242814-Prymnesium_polylepis.1